MNKIITLTQKQILIALAKDKFIAKNFYFTGGTALAELYLQHRLSDDLDFFSEDLFASEQIIKSVNNLKKIIKINKIYYSHNKNREQFILEIDNKNIKIEFVYFPFGDVKTKKTNQELQLKIDTIKSIAENKIFALYENAEPKHLFDLYWICKKKRFNLKRIFNQTEKKFGIILDKVMFLEKAFEAIDKMDKIKPMIFPEYKVTKENLIKFIGTIK